MNSSGPFRRSLFGTTLVVVAFLPFALGHVRGVVARSAVPASFSEAPTETPAVAPPEAASTGTATAADVDRRRDAHQRDVLAVHGRRDTRNLALDDERTEVPSATSSVPGAGPLDAVDGDSSTAWRGEANAPSWTWTLPFRRPVHLGLIRVLFGDSAAAGVPAAYRWEYQPLVAGRCEPWSLWTLIPHGRQDDADGNVFLYGPSDVHAQRQAFFSDIDACAVRLVIAKMDGNLGPVLREVRLLESARSVLQDPGVQVDGFPSTPAASSSTPTAVVDGAYETSWTGASGQSPWTLTIRLPEPRIVDRLRFVLGHDAVTVATPAGHGRRYQGANLPLRYTVATSPDDDLRHLIPLDEGASPENHGEPLPLRRRLIRFHAPRPVRMLRLVITDATGPAGERTPSRQAPVVRDVGLYEAADERPVVTEPVFLSVNANPARLTERLGGGAAFADGLFARAFHHRLRRVLVGFDVDSRWPADASRPRDASAGRFLEAIEGDDPTLNAAFLGATAPPPIVLLSGGFDWDFDDHTAPHATRRGHWSWNVLAGADDPDRGMGHLRDVVLARQVPLLGVCGGAQILALLHGSVSPPNRASLEQIDAMLLRNGNEPIRGLLTQREPYEHAWWYDLPKADAKRPTIVFEPHGPLFDFSTDAAPRSTTQQLPSSHGDMIRLSALASRDLDLSVAAWSDFCRPWVRAQGPEPTWPDPTQPGAVCVRIPQAFRSRSLLHYPLMGFQFHPEERDLPRLRPDHEDLAAKGDALNTFANAIDLALDSLVRLFWPDA